MNKIETFFTDYKNTITILSGFIIVISFFIAADGYINNQIENKITDEMYINKLSKILRPFSIFNKEGVITYDHGGEDFIKKIFINRKKNGDFKKIIIETKSFLQNAPILIYMGHEKYAYTSKKVASYTWEFTLSNLSCVPTVNSPDLGKFSPSFLIEIMI